MISENAPVAPDEFVIRCVWGQFFNPALPVPIVIQAFAPRKDETEGISVFRTSCLTSAEDVLGVFAEAKRGLYALVAISVSDIESIGLTVEASPITAIPGHAVIPELNADRCKADKQWCDGIKRRLAMYASARILRAPLA